MRAKPVTAFAAAIMAVALSGCATTVPGTPTASPSEVAASRTSTSTPAAGDEFLNYRWIDVSDPVHRTEPRLGTDALPGVGIDHQKAPGDWSRCTIGPAVGNDSGNGFITAGHCFGMDGVQVLMPCAACQPTPFGTLQKSKDEMTGGFIDDSGFIPADITGPVTSFAGTLHVAGVLTMDGVRKLPKGTAICIDGSLTGLQCAPKAAVDTLIRTESSATEDNGSRVGQHGDSGSAVFVAEQGTNRVALVGILHGGCDDNSCGWSTFLDPALERLGVKACLDPSVTAFRGPMFSENVRSCR